MNFSEEWDKLKNLYVGKVITTVRWNNYPVSCNTINEPINLKEKLIARAEVIAVERLKMSQLRLSFIQFDTKEEFTFQDFYALMVRFYSKKPDWDGWASNVKIYYLKITEICNV